MYFDMVLEKSSASNSSRSNLSSQMKATSRRNRARMASISTKTTRKNKTIYNYQVGAPGRKQFLFPSQNACTIKTIVSIIT